jgi:hypothetical protein
MTINSTNIKNEQSRLILSENTDKKKSTTTYDVGKIRVLSWDRENNVARLNLLRRSIPSPLDN